MIPLSHLKRNTPLSVTFPILKNPHIKINLSPNILQRLQQFCLIPKGVNPNRATIQSLLSLPHKEKCLIFCYLPNSQKLTSKPILLDSNSIRTFGNGFCNCHFPRGFNTHKKTLHLPLSYQFSKTYFKIKLSTFI